MVNIQTQDKDTEDSRFAPAVESRAVTAARAIPKLAQAALGIGIVSRETRDARVAVCLACPGGHYKSGVCGELARRTGRTCGCVVDRKAWLKNETCPNGYWKT